MYSEKVMDHFQNPRNVGELENPSGVGTVGNAKCGDIMRIYLDIDDNQIIRDCKFKTFGCGAAVRLFLPAQEALLAAIPADGGGVPLSPLLGRILSAVADRRRVVHLQFPALFCALLAAHLVLLCHDVAAGALLFHRGVCHAELHG